MLFCDIDPQAMVVKVELSRCSEDLQVLLQRVICTHLNLDLLTHSLPLWKHHWSHKCAFTRALGLCQAL